MIPRDAREVYCNEKGEPIAYCPKESIGLGDLERGSLYAFTRERLLELRNRAVEKGPDFVVACFDVDDRIWTPVVEQLMPGHDWDVYRRRGETPIARGVVPRGFIVELIATTYPAAGDAPPGAFIAVFASGGATYFEGES